MTEIIDSIAEDCSFGTCGGKRFKLPKLSRWEGLKRDCEEKHDKVDQTREFYSWLLDVGEEKTWISEKIKSLNLDGTRDNLPAVNRLLKKFVLFLCFTFRSLPSFFGLCESREVMYEKDNPKFWPFLVENFPNFLKFACRYDLIFSNLPVGTTYSDGS